ncbi:MAG: metal-dependent transcriptional regulator [Prolixibacteraceae bacterium]|nr:metal-dependent transcriptional regulator [Prolixibacteraceae bacterium]
MQILKSGEMYLETILILSQIKPKVRAIDVGEYMGFSKPSVSRAVGLLKNGGYITVDAKGYIALTEAGSEIANKIYDRHKLLTEFFMNLGVDEKIATKDACKVEHDISEETFDAICRHAKKNCIR